MEVSGHFGSSISMKKIQKIFDTYALWIIISLAATFAILYSMLSVLRHMHFQSGAFDLGIFDQSWWQYAHFLSPYNTVKEKFILGDHFNLIMPFLVPLYWIWSDVKTLLIFQAAWVSFSMVGIYLYLQKRLFSKFQSLLLSVTYIIFYGIQFGLFFDFHPILLTVGILAWILYFWESEKWKLFWISIFFLLLTQENAGVALVGLCCIWLFQKKRMKLVGILACLGIVATGLSFYGIHIFSQGHVEYTPKFPHSLPGMVTTFFDQPEKRQVWWYSFISFAFLPLFSLGSLIAVVGDVSQYFATGPAFHHMWTPFAHHRAILSIFLIVGVADVLIFIRLKKKQWITPLVVFLLLWCFGITYHYHFALTKLVHKEYWLQEQWMKDNDIMLSHVPSDVSIAAQQSLIPHLTHRNEIYLSYPRRDHLQQDICGQDSCWWLDFSGKPKYLVVDTHDNEWLTMTLENIENFRTAIANMEKAGVIKLFYQKGQAKIYTIDEIKLASIK